MKVSQISNNNNSQNFGALYLNGNTRKVISSRVNQNALKMEMLNRLTEKASKNKKVNVDLMVNPDGKTLSAKLYTTSNTIRYLESRKENFFSKHFQGGVLGFIKRCIRKAEIDGEKITQSELVTDFDYIDNIRKNLR